MFIASHYLCDKPGCSNSIPEACVKMKDGQNWYQIKVISSNGWKTYDFCSLACLLEQLTTDPLALSPVGQK